MKRFLFLILILSGCSSHPLCPTKPLAAPAMAPPPSPPMITSAVPRIQRVTSLAAVPPSPRRVWVDWDWQETDLIGHYFSVWNTALQQEQILQFWVWQSARLTGPWSLYCVTNRPPVPVDCTNAVSYFRVSGDYVKSPYQP